MELTILLLCILLSALLTAASLHYLSATLSTLLATACGSPEAAAFWLRCIHILALSGSLMLVVLFVPAYDGVHWLPVVRSVLGWTAAGIFLSVALVANAIWTGAVKPALAAARLSRTGGAL